MNANVLILFARYPHPGKVKTRLSNPQTSLITLSPTEACLLYKEFLRDLINRFCQCSDFDLVVRVGGATVEELEGFRQTYGLAPQQILAMPEHSSDLGALMERCFEEHAVQGYTRLV